MVQEVNGWIAWKPTNINGPGKHRISVWNLLVLFQRDRMTNPSSNSILKWRNHGITFTAPVLGILLATFWVAICRYLFMRVAAKVVRAGGTKYYHPQPPGCRVITYFAAHLNVFQGDDTEWFCENTCPCAKDLSEDGGKMGLGLEVFWRSCTNACRHVSFKVLLEAPWAHDMYIYVWN